MTWEEDHGHKLRGCTCTLWRNPMASYENGVPYTSYGREENPDCPVHNAPVKNKFQELGMEIKSSEETHGAVKCDHCGAIFGYHRIDAPIVRNQKS